MSDDWSKRLDSVMKQHEITYKEAADSQRKSLYGVQLEASEELKTLRKQFEQSQRQQEIKDREQAKENRLNHIYNLVALLVAIASMIISLVK